MCTIVHTVTLFFRFFFSFLICFPFSPLSLFCSLLPTHLKAKKNLDVHIPEVIILIYLSVCFSPNFVFPFPFPFLFFFFVMEFYYVSASEIQIIVFLFFFFFSFLLFFLIVVIRF